MKAVFDVLYLLTVAIIWCDGETLFDNEVFGPYELVWNKVALCPVHSSPIDLQLKVVNTTNRDQLLLFNMTVKKPVKMTEFRIVVYSVKDSRKTQLYRHKFLKPCGDESIQQHINMPQIEIGPGCVLLKSNYKIEMNLNGIKKKFLGENFYYGEYETKMLLFENKRIVACLQDISNIKKKTAQKKANN